jgi:hypothetical protein
MGKLQPLRPIELPGGFTLAEGGLEVRGFPSFAQYEAVGQFIERAHAAAGWWLADWIAYGDTREDWKAKVDQAVDNGDLNPATRRQYRYIAKAFPPSNRIRGVPFGHHAAVVNVEPTLRKKLLTQAMQHNWTQTELRQAAKDALKEKPNIVAQGQAFEVFEVEVTVLVTSEAETPNLAEQAAWNYLSALVKVNQPAKPLLKAQVLMMRARPKLDKGS